MVACAAGQSSSTRKYILFFSQCLDCLLSHGASLNHKNSHNQTAVYFLLKNQRWNLIVELKKQYNLIVHPGSASEELLIEKCSREDQEFFWHIFDCGVEFDAGKVLIHAASLGLLEFIKFFIEKGVDINAEYKDGNR